jgi:MFS family permease
MESPDNTRLVLRLNNMMQFLTNGAWYVAIPFFPLYLVSQGASDAVVGAVVGLAGVVPLAVSIYAGALVDERGPFVVYVASTVLFGIGGALLTFERGVPLAGVAYALMAIANIGFAVAAQAIVAAVSDDATRVRNYGYYGLWNSAGAVVGPVAGGLIAVRVGYAGAFAALWIVMLPSLAVVGGLRGVRAPARRAVRAAVAHTLVGAILRARGVGVILFVSGMMVCAQQLQNTFYPLYLHTIGLSAPHIGLVVAAVSLTTLAVRTLLAGGVAQIGRGIALLASMVVAAVAFALAPLTHSFWLLLVVSGLMGASVGFTQPLAMSLIVEFVAAEFWGVTLGIRQSVQRIAAIVSPVLFGAISTAGRVESAFYAGALLFAGASGLMTRFVGLLDRPAARD